MLAQRLIRLAVAYFAVGVGLGMFMGIRQDFRLAHVHAHLSLLGWVALALIGLAPIAIGSSLVAIAVALLTVHVMLALRRPVTAPSLNSQRATR